MSDETRVMSDDDGPLPRIADHRRGGSMRRTPFQRGPSSQDLRLDELEQQVFDALCRQYLGSAAPLKDEELAGELGRELAQVVAALRSLWRKVGWPPLNEGERRIVLRMRTEGEDGSYTPLGTLPTNGHIADVLGQRHDTIPKLLTGVYQRFDLAELKQGRKRQQLAEEASKLFGPDAQQPSEIFADGRSSGAGSRREGRHLRHLWTTVTAALVVSGAIALASLDMQHGGPRGTSADPQAVVSNGIEAVNTRDFARLRDLLAADCFFEEPATGRRVRGRDKIIRAIKGWLRIFPDAHGEIADLQGNRSHVTASIVWTGRQKRGIKTPSGIVPASGRRATTPARLVVIVRGGNIVDIRHFIEIDSMLPQLAAIAGSSPDVITDIPRP